MSNPYQIQSHGTVAQFADPTLPNYIQKDPFLDSVSPIKRLPFPYTDTIVLSARKVNFQLNTLGSTTHIYNSILYSDIIALSLFFADWGFTYVTEEGDNMKLTVTIPWDTIAESDFSETLFTAEQWEIVPKEVSQPLVNKAFFDANNNLWMLPQWAQLQTDYAFANKLLYVSLPQTIPTGSLATAPWALQQANIMLNMMRSGIKGTYSFTQTLKRSACVDANNTNRAFNTPADIAYRNLVVEYGYPNPIFSTAEMVGKYALPAAIIEQMLPSYQKVIVGAPNIMDPSATAPITVFAGWLAKAVTSQQSTKNKYTYQQEFEWGEWPQYLYYVQNPQATQYPVITVNNAGKVFTTFTSAV